MKPLRWSATCRYECSLQVPMWAVGCIYSDYRLAVWTLILIDILIERPCCATHGHSLSCLKSWTERVAAIPYPHCICSLTESSRFRRQTSGVYPLANCPPCWSTTRDKTDVYLADYVLACMLTGCLRSISDLNIIPRQNRQRHHFKMCTFCEVTTKDPGLHAVCRWIIN